MHRALVRAYGLGEGGLTGQEAGAMEVAGELISNLERRAMVAERETMDRYVAAFLADQVGALVKCRITGVQPFGFFATVEELGGDGLVPAATLGSDYYRYDESSQSLTGDQSGESYTLGQRLTLRLAEADPVSGALRFELPEAPRSARAGRAKRLATDENRVGAAVPPTFATAAAGNPERGAGWFVGRPWQKPATSQFSSAASGANRSIGRPRLRWRSWRLTICGSTSSA